jgi:hypothetical protein
MPEDCSFTLCNVDQARGSTYTIQDNLDLGAEGLRSPYNGSYHRSGSIGLPGSLSRLC